MIQNLYNELGYTYTATMFDVSDYLGISRTVGIAHSLQQRKVALVKERGSGTTTFLLAQAFKMMNHNPGFSVLFRSASMAQRICAFKSLMEMLEIFDGGGYVAAENMGINYADVYSRNNSKIYFTHRENRGLRQYDLVVIDDADCFEGIDINAVMQSGKNIMVSLGTEQDRPYIRELVDAFYRKDSEWHIRYMLSSEISKRNIQSQYGEMDMFRVVQEYACNTTRTVDTPYLVDMPYSQHEENVRVVGRATYIPHPHIVDLLRSRSLSMH